MPCGGKRKIRAREGRERGLSRADQVNRKANWNWRGSYDAVGVPFCVPDRIHVGNVVLVDDVEQVHDPLLTANARRSGKRAQCEGH